MKTYISVIAMLFMIAGIGPHASAQFDPADPETDKLVETCLETKGVNMLPGSDVICYNSAIYPEQFLQLNEFPTASRIIITSPGGNVATARIMSKILDQRGEPAVIAGPCMSACAMVLLPGLDSVHIHNTAHIAVHGITMMKYRTWWGWLRGGEMPGKMDFMTAQLGYDFDFAMHNSGKSQMKAHLKGQHVEQGFIDVISEQMQADALTYECRLDPKDYWGILDANHIRQYLGDRVIRMEAFAQSWGDPNNQAYKSITTPISDQTYIFDDQLDEAACDAA
ncbi:MAG: hypothetical protein Hens3KO_12790 [Henriciella sp.]